MKIRYLFLSVLLLCTTQSSFSALQDVSEITPLAKAQLTDKILSPDEINHGANETQKTYIACLSQTNETVQEHFPNANQDILIGILASNCSSPEDLFNIYNILLASYNEKTPMSESQAASYLENSYKTYGREISNSTIRLKILKLLNIIQN